MSKTIYQLRDAAFSNVSAYAILHNGAAIGSVSLKFPKDGAGRLYAYVHLLGAEMVRGSSTGYGYDKATAALASASKQFPHDLAKKWAADHGGLELPSYFGPFIAAIAKDGGQRWDSALRDAGFEVFQTV